MQVTVVVADFFPEPESLAAAAGDLPRLPGLEMLLRYGRRADAPRDWRAWLAADVGWPDLAALPPARVAAAALREASSPELSAWFAAPVHLLAGMDHLRLHPAGLLRLEEAEAARYAASFAEVFAASGWLLQPLCGGFLLRGLAGGFVANAWQRDPARWLGANIAPAVAQGLTAPAVRSATAEIEMWLHEHVLNRVRAGRGELAVNSLWLWGGGDAGVIPVRGQDHDERVRAVMPLQGGEGFVAGLRALAGEAPTAPAAQFGELIAAARGADCHVVVSAAASSLRDAPLLRIDRDWLLPALEALRSGTISQLRVHIGAQRVTLRAAGLRRFWRRPLPWWQAFSQA
jgi:hypothetical protein